MAEKDEHQHDNEDHKRTNGEDPSKPWETLFDDDRDDQGNLSRVATKKKRQGSSKLTWILAILLILVVLAPIMSKFLVIKAAMALTFLMIAL